ncbi:MAG: DNA-methyltransferase [bacterium]
MDKVPINTVIQGNCLKVLKKFPSEIVDLIFADPPYFGNQKNHTIRRTDGYASGRFSTGKADWAFSKSLEYQFEFTRAWLSECKRILKTGCTIWITGTYHSIGVINVVLQDLKYKILNDIILYKKNAPPNFRGSCFRACTETMLWAKKSSNGRTKFNYTLMKQLNGGKQMNNVWEYKAIKTPYWHPATKQEIVLERVILAGSHQGDIVLDPFGGSGTTAAVAKRLGRKWITIEIDPKYCDMIRDRVNHVK